MSNAGKKIVDYLYARRESEFDSAMSPPADRAHSRELLAVAELEPTRHNILWLRRLMSNLGWIPSGNIRINGKQGYGYIRGELG